MYGQPVDSDRACPRKVKYETWEDAETGCRLLIDDIQQGKLKRYKGGHHFAYKCDWCSGWHIGTTSPYVTFRAMMKAGWAGRMPYYRKSSTRILP